MPIRLYVLLLIVAVSLTGCTRERKNPLDPNCPDYYGAVTYDRNKDGKVDEIKYDEVKYRDSVKLTWVTGSNLIKSDTDYDGKVDSIRREITYTSANFPEQKKIISIYFLGNDRIKIINKFEVVANVQRYCIEAEIVPALMVDMNEDSFSKIPDFMDTKASNGYMNAMWIISENRLRKGDELYVTVNKTVQNYQELVKLDIKSDYSKQWEMIKDYEIFFRPLEGVTRQNIIKTLGPMSKWNTPKKWDFSENEIPWSAYKIFIGFVSYLTHGSENPVIYNYQGGTFATKNCYFYINETKVWEWRVKGTESDYFDYNNEERIPYDLAIDDPAYKGYLEYTKYFYTDKRNSITYKHENPDDTYYIYMIVDYIDWR